MAAPRLLIVNPNTNTATTAMMVEAARDAAACLDRHAAVVGATAPPARR
jgi:Asp/Glu/hydantoin racemase